ncbi:g-D-glutamyl-meso-diaminopimelate peptidase [Paenibacillus sophorae]|uniref:G-D-glutamyl-meso-diaminopimelate peptidase n=1 Tax=Paenibacillus sophorae TaxID=1333845 RepID=A0A1H8TU37_9BACL|nr:M14 family zinc carboxypeptidase [Paenibacillus sophorae]QWU18034.1 LysM peptidoglycan-binding domain-containing protein [Paenibacillus sophorae]SEO94427.1 g-D-glutamyl-meso-diaminopimelate peptidase [Paenibacillus sophorae]
MLQYIVRKGDTVRRIAAAYGLTPGHVIQGNPWTADQPYLFPGQVLFLPSVQRRRYTAQEGERMRDVAALYGVSLEALEQLNPGISPDGFCTPGKTLVIPMSEQSAVVHLRGEYGHSELEADISLLTNKYPFISAGTIGSSVLGKPLHLLRIGSGRRRLHVNAALHANEWLTSPCLLAFLEQYAEAYAKGRKWNGHSPEDWFNNWTVWAVPMANPDGVELVQEGAGPWHPYRRELVEWNGGRRSFRHWKANIRGVDLGDQFPAFWEEEQSRRGMSGPSPRDYGGPSPLSEPEAAALVSLCEKAPADMAVSLHSQGQEIYWNYRGYEPPESREIAERLALAGGYRAVALTESDAGFKDWFIMKFGKPGFTVELGLGRNPLPLEDFEDLTLETGQILASILSQ